LGQATGQKLVNLKQHLNENKHCIQTCLENWLWRMLLVRYAANISSHVVHVVGRLGPANSLLGFFLVGRSVLPPPMRSQVAGSCGARAADLEISGPANTGEVRTKSERNATKTT
jgi:hypothetical protein